MSSGESSEIIRNRVISAREIQRLRFEDTGIYCNAQMTTKTFGIFIVFRIGQVKLCSKMPWKKLGLSARAYDRILKVARTIADLEGVENILPEHLGRGNSIQKSRPGWRWGS